MNRDHADEAALPLEVEQRRSRTPSTPPKDIAVAIADERAAAVGAFAAGVAHVLERPLSEVGPSLLAALGALEVHGDVEGAAAAIRDALDATESADQLARALNGFASLTAEPPEGGVAVHEALELAIHLAQREVAARARLVRRYGPAPPVRGRIPRLAAVFAALLRNAAEAIPRFLPSANTIAIETSVADDGRVIVRVSDTGVGIEKEDLPYLFDPFFTTKSRGGVPGMGLAIVRAELAAIGGHIGVTSEVGRGSVFTVTLEPMAETDGHALGRYFSSEAAPTRSVLCVAGTRAACHEVARTIVDEDARITLATWDEALETLSLGASFDLILAAPEPAEDEGFRTKLRNVAPEALARTFRVSLRHPGSGVFRKTAPQRAAGW